jgi:ferrous-iron efflux pump FieF
MNTTTSNSDKPSTPRVGGLAAVETAALTARVTRLSVGLALLLVAAKGAAWLFSGSVGMLASLGDSALDLVATMTTFFAVRYAAVPPDDEHRFGHGKAEAFASLVQAGLVFGSAALIGREAIDHLLHPTPVQAQIYGIVVLLVSTVAVVGLVWAQTRVLSQTGSVAVHGDRAHYLADIVCNVAAMIGLAGALIFKEPRIDAAAGLFVAGWLVWGAIGVFQEAAAQLMDRELGPEDRELILSLAAADPAVLGVHQLRSRASGPFVHMQMHMELDPSMPLSEAHRIVVAAERRILEAFPAADILIHADPEGQAEPHGGAFGEYELPSRHERAGTP